MAKNLRSCHIADHPPSKRIKELEVPRVACAPRNKVKDQLWSGGDLGLRNDEQDQTKRKYVLELRLFYSL